jgi:hypothetical protein
MCYSLLITQLNYVVKFLPTCYWGIRLHAASVGKREEQKSRRLTNLVSKTTLEEGYSCSLGDYGLLSPLRKIERNREHYSLFLIFSVPL